MNLTRTRSRGDFACPRCQAMTSYRLRARRPFLTLYFIPTVPVGAAELFVQCDQCREKFDAAILDSRNRVTPGRHDPRDDDAGEGAEFIEQLLRACVLVVIADGTISEAEIATLSEISVGLTGERLDREELGWLCSSAQQNQVTLTNYLISVAGRWDAEERILAAQTFFIAACGDGPIGPEQMAAMLEMREILDFDTQSFRRAIEQVA